MANGSTIQSLVVQAWFFKVIIYLNLSRFFTDWGFVTAPESFRCHPANDRLTTSSLDQLEACGFLQDIWVMAFNLCIHMTDWQRS